jgi:uncharacterized protein YpmS
MMTVEEDVIRREEPARPPTPGSPPPSTPRRWPALVLVALGGVLVGMLLVLGLTFASGPRAVPGSPGDPSAAFDSTIILNDAYLTAQAKTGGNQIQEPRMHAGADGKVTLDGRVSVFGIGAPLHAILQPTVVNGELQMTVVSGQVGGFPLNDVLARQIESTVADVVKRPPAKVATTLVRVEVKDGQMILYDKVK